MCCIWDIAIWTPSLLPLYVPFELCEKFGIRFGPPPTFWDNVPHFCFFFYFEGIPKGVRLLNYEVDLWEKKRSDTKEALASDVKEVKNGSTVTNSASELPKEVNAVVKGINSNASVFLASSPG